MTEFEEKILRETCKIPLGEVRTYSWLAQQCGRPRAHRAVANALKKNPWPLAVPCHRVIRSSGELGGYSLGRRLKRELIKLEKKAKDMIK